MAEGLPWFRADTNIPTHDKITDLIGEHGAKGKAAAFVYIASLAWSVGHGADGLIKRGTLPFIHATSADARLLVAGEFWEAVDGGWHIVNYGTRQVVGAAQQVIAEELSATRREAGKQGADARWKP